MKTIILYAIGICLFLPFICFSQQYYFDGYGGTTVITVVRNDSIWVAADSKIYNTPGPGAKGKMKDFGNYSCKIHVDKGIIYVMLGTWVYFKAVVPGYDYNSYDIMKAAIIKEQNFESAFTLFETNIKTAITKMLKFQADKTPQYFFKNMLNSYPLYVLAIQFQNGKFTIKNRGYYVSGSSPSDMLVIPTSINKDFKRPGVLLNGIYNNIKPLIDKKQYLNGGNMRAELEYLIKLEASKKPEAISLPVDIILLHNKGYKWVQLKKQCL